MVFSPANCRSSLKDRFEVGFAIHVCVFMYLHSLIGCLAASRDELHIRKMKLNYQEVGQCSKDAQALWERKLTAPGRTTVQQDKKELYHALCQGEWCVYVGACVN